MKSIIFEIINVLDNISLVEGFVEKVFDELKINSNLNFNVQLCLDEILTNIIKYGYDDGREDVITLQFQKNSKSLIVTFIDNGKEFNPLNVKEPDFESHLLERKVGGLGVHIVKQMTVSQDYKRINNRNFFTIEFDISDK